MKRDCGAGPICRRQQIIMKQVTPFLMFVGRAKEALDFYRSVFPRFEVESLNLDPADETKVRTAVFRLGEQRVMCIDSPAVHDFTFTPAVSFFIECANSEEIETLFAKLIEGGAALMPLDDYGFSARFGWLNDRFGVSWQLNLAVEG